MSDPYIYFVGIDWGRKFHRFCVLDHDGQAVARRNCQHLAEPIRQMALWLLERVDHEVEHLKVGVEVPTGPLVLALQSFGVMLWSINPKQSSRLRDRRDAQIIASALRTDPQAFREVPALTKKQPKMRRLVHCRGRLIRQKVKLSNQLNELLADYFPALLEIAEDMAQSWFLCLLLKASTPHQAHKMTRSELHKLLKEHRIRRVDADALLPILRQQPFPGVDPMAPPEAIETAILVPQLQLVLSQIKDMEHQMDEVIERWCQAPPEAQPPR